MSAGGDWQRPWDRKQARRYADVRRTHNAKSCRSSVSSKSLNISIKRDRLLAMLTDTLAEPSQDNGKDNIILLEATVPAAPRGGSSKLIFENQNGKTPDAVVVKAVAR